MDPARTTEGLPPVRSMKNRMTAMERTALGLRRILSRPNSLVKKDIVTAKWVPLTASRWASPRRRKSRFRESGRKDRFPSRTAAASPPASRPARAVNTEVSLPLSLENSTEGLRECRTPS